MIHEIRPYKDHGQWMFDDESRGLKRELFVGGADDILDTITANIPKADKGFNLRFADHAFPGAEICFYWKGVGQFKLLDGPEYEAGDVYFSPHLNMEGWLCPALMLYFPQAPRQLFVSASPIVAKTRRKATA
jgi:hypothetical protein